MRLSLARLGLPLLLALLGASTAGAVDLVVTTLDESSLDPQECDLRDAILAARSDIQVQACGPGSGDDVIDLTGLEGTIALESELPELDGPLTIRGPGPELLTVSGADAVRVFRVVSGPVVIEDLRIADGRAEGNGRGGGIHVDPPGADLLPRVTLRRCLVEDNTAFNGGGIANDAGDLHVEASTIRGNATSGNSGAGVLNSAGVAVIENSTLLSNVADATRPGGGVANFGVLLPEGPVGGLVELRNVTLSGNEAREGGGVFNDEGLSILRMANTVVEGSTGGSCAGEITSEGYNLSDDETCGLAGAGDLEGVAAELESTGLVGGIPLTKPPRPGSPLVDGGRPTGCNDSDGFPLGADQRGEPRPFDGDGDGDAVCDVGAVELQVVPEPRARGVGLASLAALALLAGDALRRSPST